MSNDAALLAHELGHGRAARSLGLRAAIRMNSAGALTCTSYLEPCGDTAGPRGLIAAAGPAAAIGYRITRSGRPLPTRIRIAELRAEPTCSLEDRDLIDQAISAGRAESVAHGVAIGLRVGREVADWSPEDIETHLRVLDSGSALEVFL